MLRSRRPSASATDDGFGYRNHVHLSVDRRGYDRLLPRRHPRGRARWIRCLLLHPLLREWQEKLPPLPGAKRLELRAGTRTFQRLALLRGYIDENAGEESYQRGIPLGRAGEGELTEMVGVERFRISSKSFFQVNTDGAEKLVELVMEMLERFRGRVRRRRFRRRRPVHRAHGARRAEGVGGGAASRCRAGPAAPRPRVQGPDPHRRHRHAGSVHPVA